MRLVYFTFTRNSSVDEIGECYGNGRLNNAVVVKLYLYSIFPRTENAPFQPCILLRITRYNDYVMRPRSYSRILRNRKTYANANANGNNITIIITIYKAHNVRKKTESEAKNWIWGVKTESEAKNWIWGDDRRRYESLNCINNQKIWRRTMEVHKIGSMLKHEPITGSFYSWNTTPFKNLMVAVSLTEPATIDEPQIGRFLENT